MRLAGVLAALVGAGAPLPVATAPAPEPRPGSRLPRGAQWVPHQGNQERMRRFRQSHRAVLKLKDRASLAALARVRAAVAEEPDPEFGELHLVHAARVCSMETGITWAQAADHLLDAFRRNEETGLVAPIEAGA